MAVYGNLANVRKADDGEAPPPIPVYQAPVEKPPVRLVIW